MLPLVTSLSNKETSATPVELDIKETSGEWHRGVTSCRKGGEKI